MQFRRKFTDTQRAQILTAYRAHAKVIAIAAEFNCCASLPARLAREAGDAPLRPSRGLDRRFKLRVARRAKAAPQRDWILV